MRLSYGFPEAAVEPAGETRDVSGANRLPLMIRGEPHRSLGIRELHLNRGLRVQRELRAITQGHREPFTSACSITTICICLRTEQIKLARGPS